MSNPDSPRGGATALIDFCSAASKDGSAICRLALGHDEPHVWTTINRTAPAPSQGCGVAVLRTHEPPAVAANAVWLIERGHEEQTSPPLWWRRASTPNSLYEWTETASLATPFATREAAQNQFDELRGILSVHGSFGRVTEHVFLPAVAANPACAQCGNPRHLHTSAEVHRFIEAANPAPCEWCVAEMRRLIASGEEVRGIGDPDEHFPDCPIARVNRDFTVQPEAEARTEASWSKLNAYLESRPSPETPPAPTDEDAQNIAQLIVVCEELKKRLVPFGASGDGYDSAIATLNRFASLRESLAGVQQQQQQNQDKTTKGQTHEPELKGEGSMRHYVPNFGEVRRGVVAVALPLGSVEAIERLARDCIAFGSGIGTAPPYSSEQLAWHEKAEAARVALMENVRALSTDSERLDWLESQFVVSAGSDDHSDGFFWTPDMGSSTITPLREAIDGARGLFNPPAPESPVTSHLATPRPSETAK